MLFYISILVKKLKNANAPLILAIFLVMSCLVSAWFLGGSKGANGQEFLKNTTLVSTAKGAVNALSLGVVATNGGNEVMRGVVADSKDLDLTKDTPSKYVNGFIKDPRMLSGQATSSALPR